MTFRKKKKVGLAIQDATGNELMTVRKIDRDGNNLVIRGKIFGAMPMVAKVSPSEARKVFKIINFKTVLFLITFLFRKD